MKNTGLIISPIKWALLIFLSIILFSGCTSLANYSTSEKSDELNAKIYQFNKRFEGRMMELSASYIPLDKRRQFMEDSLKIQEQVLFYGSSILEVKLFENETPVTFQENGPAHDFNKAVVTMRYQLAVLPSNRLKTLHVDQLWLWENDGWYVVPDLDGFFQ